MSFQKFLADWVFSSVWIAVAKTNCVWVLSLRAYGAYCKGDLSHARVILRGDPACMAEVLDTEVG